MSAHKTNRPGFTRLELFIVLLILGFLALLMLPALDTHSDRRGAHTWCLNNMKQMALAVHAYHTSRKGKFPTGTIIASAKAPEDRLSGLVWLIPYLEQEQLYKQLDREQGWQAEVNRPLVTKSIPTFNCPAASYSDPKPHHFTHYIGVTGVGEDAATLPVKHPRAGVFGHDRQLNWSDLADGASHALMFLETTRDNGPWAAGGRPTLRAIDPNEERSVRAGGAFGGVHPEQRWPWQRPDVWVNAAMADGSVRGIAGRVSPEVLAALATVGGEKLLPEDW